MKNKLRLAWLAGMIDGEGNVALYPKRGGVDARIAITSVNKRLIDEIEDILKSNNINFGRTLNEKKRMEWRTAYYIYVCSHRDLKNLIPLILPHLIQKKEVAKNLLLWVEQREKSRKMGPEERLLLSDYYHLKEYTQTI